MTVPKPLPTDLIDSLLADYKNPEDLIGEHGLFKQLIKALVERVLRAETIDHLGAQGAAKVIQEQFVQYLLGSGRTITSDDAIAPSERLPTSANLPSEPRKQKRISPLRIFPLLSRSNLSLGM